MAESKQDRRSLSARLRREIDLDSLAELLAVVDQTMQPSRAFLRPRPSAHPWPPSGSHSDETDIRRERRSPVRRGHAGYRQSHLVRDQPRRWPVVLMGLDVDGSSSCLSNVRPTPHWMNRLSPASSSGGSDHHRSAARQTSGTSTVDCCGSAASSSILRWWVTCTLT
jgi:hypothetical protein